MQPEWKLRPSTAFSCRRCHQPLTVYYDFNQAILSCERCVTIAGSMGIKLFDWFLEGRPLLPRPSSWEVTKPDGTPLELDPRHHVAGGRVTELAVSWPWLSFSYYPVLQVVLLVTVLLLGSGIGLRFSSLALTHGDEVTACVLALGSLIVAAVCGRASLEAIMNRTTITIANGLLTVTRGPLRPLFRSLPNIAPEPRYMAFDLRYVSCFSARDRRLHGDRGNRYIPYVVVEFVDGRTAVVADHLNNTLDALYLEQLLMATLGRPGHVAGRHLEPG